MERPEAFPPEPGSTLVAFASGAPQSKRYVYTGGWPALATSTCATSSTPNARHRAVPYFTTAWKSSPCHGISFGGLEERLQLLASCPRG